MDYAKQKTNTKWHWMQVVACAAIMFGTMGLIANSTSVFTAQFVAEYGFTTAQSQLFFSIQNITMVIFTPIAQIIGSKMNYRACISIAVVLAGAGLALLSVLTSVPGCYLSSVLYGISYSFICYLLISIVIANWFAKKTGTMMGIASAFTGVGGAIWSIVAGQLCGNLGLQKAALIMSVISIIISLPFALFVIRQKPEDKNLLPYGYESTPEPSKKGTKPSEKANGLTLKQAVHTPVFWIAVIAMFLIYFAAQFQTIFTTYAKQELGFGIQVSAVMASMVMIGLIVGKLLLGMFNDKFGVKATYIYGVAAGIIAFILFLTASGSTPVQVYIGAFLFGSCFALMSIGTPLLVSQTMGAKEYAKILSWVLTVGLVANSLASAVNGLMADVLGYNAIMIMASIMLIVALFLVITAISIAGRKAKK